MPRQQSVWLTHIRCKKVDQQSTFKPKLKHSQSHVKTENEAYKALRQQDKRTAQIDPKDVDSTAMRRSEVRMLLGRLLWIRRLLRNTQSDDRRVRFAEER